LRDPWPAAADFQPAPTWFLRWRPTIYWAAILGIMFGFSTLISNQLPKEFLYWRF
jgi:hypothetical protein